MSRSNYSPTYNPSGRPSPSAAVSSTTLSQPSLRPTYNPSGKPSPRPRASGTGAGKFKPRGAKILSGPQDPGPNAIWEPGRGWVEPVTELFVPAGRPNKAMDLLKAVDVFKDLVKFPDTILPIIAPLEEIFNPDPHFVESPLREDLPDISDVPFLDTDPPNDVEDIIKTLIGLDSINDQNAELARSSAEEHRAEQIRQQLEQLAADARAAQRAQDAAKTQQQAQAARDAVQESLKALEALNNIIHDPFQYFQESPTQAQLDFLKGPQKAIEPEITEWIEEDDDDNDPLSLTMCGENPYSDKRYCQPFRP